MPDIEQLLTREEQLEDLSNDQFLYAQQYKAARIKYAEVLSYVKVELAKNIASIQMQKKNVGMDMAEIMLMAKDAKTEDQWFIKACKTRDTKRAEYKGFQELIDAVKSRKMSILGIMRNGADTERYTKGTAADGSNYQNV